MPYVKPGVEITQVERSQSPVLITPELEVAILGTAQHWQDPRLETSKASGVLKIDSGNSTGHDVTYNIADLGYAINDLTNVVIDLVATGSNSAGLYGKVFHVNVEVAGSTSRQTVTLASNIITVKQTISPANDDFFNHFEDFDDDAEFLVYVGFLAEKTSANVHKVIESYSDIQEQLGEPKTFNPLGYGAHVAMLNSGTAINTFGHIGSQNCDAHLADFELKDIYTIAGMDHDSDPVAYKQHVEGQSISTAKHERIAFVNVARPSEIEDGLTSTERAANALTIQSANAAIGSKRVFSIHPDRGYVHELRHPATLTSKWIVGSFAGSASQVIATGKHDAAKLISDVSTSTTTYKAGTKITSTILADLMASGWGENSDVMVDVPVPGYYYAAAVAGAVVGMPIQQPLTYYSISGINEVYGGLDMFSEANLNTMAEGGTMILVQNKKSTPVYCRHQLSTDVTTIERKELSITKQVDYTAKYIRKTLDKYAGKYNITPNFIGLVEANLRGISEDLVLGGIIADLKVLSVYQDTISPDTVRAEVEITVKYPANYIKVRLII